MSRARTITVGPPDTARFEVQHGRNFIRRGDLVRARPSVAGKHDGFMARFCYADEDRGGLFYCVQEVEGARIGKLRSCGYRFLKPERVRRLQRSKGDGE
jgi:hypothetical protein